MARSIAAALGRIKQYPLGVIRPAADPRAAARAALELWDAWVLDGRRFGGAA